MRWIKPHAGILHTEENEFLQRSCSFFFPPPLFLTFQFHGASYPEAVSWHLSCCICASTCRCGGSCHVCPKPRRIISFPAHLCCITSSSPTVSHHSNPSSSPFCTGGLLLLLLSSFDVMFTIVHHVSSLPQQHLTFLSDQTWLHVELHVLLLSYSLVIISSPAVSLCIWVSGWMAFLFIKM